MHPGPGDPADPSSEIEQGPGQASSPPTGSLLDESSRTLLYLVTMLAFAALMLLLILWMSPAWL